VAEKTIDKFLARAARLYEREQEEPFGSPLLGLYVKRWLRWVSAGHSYETRHDTRPAGVEGQWACALHGYCAACEEVYGARTRHG